MPIQQQQQPKAPFTAFNSTSNPPYSSASLNVRSRSLDQRRFPAFSGTPDRAIYISGGGGGTTTTTTARSGGSGSGFSGELFAANRAGAARTVATTAGTPPQQQTATTLGEGRKGMNATVIQHYKSNSVERPGVTVVPIRRESTLPARQFQTTTEWKSSEWKNDGTGGAIVPQRTERRLEEGSVGQQQQDEHYVFERSTKFGHNRQAWNKPKTTSYREEKMIEAVPRTTTDGAEYATFIRGRQRVAGAEAAAAAGATTAQQQQHQQHEQHTRQQQHQREYREWHSGNRRQQQSGGGGVDHYGMYGGRSAAGQQQQQHQIMDQPYGTAGGGPGGADAAYRYRHQQYQSGGGQQQQHYANGWGTHQRHVKRSASAGATGYYGTAGKSNRSSSAAYYGAGGPKRYRKIRFCCFNLIWPPWAVEPSGPPRPMYSSRTTKASDGGAISPIPLEQHQPPPPPQFYNDPAATSAIQPSPPTMMQPPHTGADVHREMPPPAGPEQQMPYAARMQAHEYGPSAYGGPPNREQQRMGVPGGIDVPDYSKQQQQGRSQMPPPTMAQGAGPRRY